VKAALNQEAAVTLDDLVDEHKAQLGSKVAGRFTAADDADFVRHLQNAATRLASKCLRWVSGTLSLTAAVADYPAPLDLLGAPTTDWGRQHFRQPWDDDYLGHSPLLLPVTVADEPMLRLVPGPTSAQIAAWGDTLTYRYLASHQITAELVTFGDLQRPLVLLAALIEAMRELATDTTVVQLQKGLAGLPTAGTPAYLYEKLRLELEQA
jgi:hypothetical protein